MIVVDIGGIVDHHSMSSGERWFLLILVELLTITQWVKVRGDFCWYWWNCWPSLNELRWEVIFVDIGGIVDHHSMNLGERCFLLILVELLTITQWVEVRYDCCWYWWNCWPSLNEFRWEVIFVDISGIVDHHSMSWVERWFLLILVELLTITQWVDVRGDFCWYWWWSTIPPISTKITSQLNSLSDGQQFHQYQQKSPLTSTHWVMVNNSTNINKNHLSPQYIEWNCWPSLNELKWEVMFVDIGGIVDHHSISWIEGWFLLILVVELLTITQWIEVRGDFCWYWWNCWPSLNELKWDMIVVDIGGIVDNHSMNLGERWFLLILVKLLTITQWVEVRYDCCWYWWNCWPSLNEFRWEVIFVDISGIVDHHSMS